MGFENIERATTVFSIINEDQVEDTMIQLMM